MKSFTSLISLAIMALFPASASAERLIAKVDKSKQTMIVTLDDEIIYNWLVSSGKKGFDTPSGAWTAQSKFIKYFSKKYDNAPMPYAVFFFDGYAIHGTTAVKMLGRPASHGCIRLLTKNAKTFNELVTEVGLKETKLIIED